MDKQTADDVNMDQPGGATSPVIASGAGGVNPGGQPQGTRAAPIIRMTVSQPLNTDPAGGYDNIVTATAAAGVPQLQSSNPDTPAQNPPAPASTQTNASLSQTAMPVPNQPTTMMGRSMPVSPTYVRSPVNPPNPPPTNPTSPNQAFYQSPANSTQSTASTSTTSFLANQHQQHNPQSLNTTAVGQQQHMHHPSMHHHPPPTPTQPPQQAPPINHRMALNDAFSYLDRVKSEFASQPDVYNKFLQVMREFKANVIDANGVIVRVVQLFRGHRDLILGFNAFLPKTHHIDAQVAESGELPANFVAMHGAASTLTSPSTTISPTNNPISPSTATMIPGYPSIAQRPLATATNSTVAPPPPPPPTSHLYPTGQPPLGRPPGAAAYSIATAASLPPQPPPQLQPPIANGPGAALKKSTNAQFTRAIAYVKKVKQRFANDPESYKTFLGALHSFHKDQRSVAEVCAQVQRLFKDHADLMDDFVQFLPESANDFNMMPSMGRSTMGNRLPPMGQFTPDQASRRDMDQPMAPTTTQPPSAPQTNPISVQIEPPKQRSKRTRPHPPPPPAHHQPGITKTAEEVDFFERVKRHLGNRQVYAEFLKCLNMYSQSILKLSELIQLVSGFIGGNEELFSWFKRYIGYNGSVEDGADALARAQDANQFIHGPHDLPEINLATCRRLGSYRLLPASHKLAPSSGRTELCREVLNDEMISCPTFASEDSTFVSSKKNAYEEALFRCEDERFELDLLIDGNRATIAVLEPLSKMLASVDNHGEFVLDGKLNGSSAMIYRRAIKRVYGEKADEVYEALQRTPSVSIPVVLRRLKQKDEEWQRARRDWQRVWREVHVKNFYRSLDHQSIDYKQTDRRSASVKQLVQELDVLAEERRRAGLVSKAPLVTVESISDSQVVNDAFKLLLVAIKHTGSIASADRKPVKQMLQRILPLFFPSLRHQSIPAVSKEETGSAGSESDMSDHETATSLPTDPHLLFNLNVNNSANGTNTVVYHVNSALYGIVKMFGTIVERLSKLKNISVNGKNSDCPYSMRDRQNVVARLLDLNLRDSEDEDQETSVTVEGDCYKTLVKQLKRLIGGHCEPALFEEQARFLFGLEAFTVFTVDRILHAILRQCHGLLPSVSESSKGEQLVRLLEDSRRLPEYTCRMSAEAIIISDPKDRLIRVQLVSDVRTNLHQLQVSLVDSTLITDLSMATPEQRWSAYVDSFVRLDVNPLYADGSGRGVYLKRCLNRSLNRGGTPLVQYHLECKICVNTYKLHYVENTEDFLSWKHAVKEAGLSKRGSRFRQWLSKITN